MKRTILILFVLVVVTKSYGQESTKRNVNFIIMVDEKIPFQGDMNMQFIIENKKSDTIRVDYIPGNIILEESEFNKMILMGVKSISLEIHYSKLCKKEVKSYSYKIDFKQAWLQFNFTILRIYNLDSKKNKKIFFPLEGQQYTYEMDSPNGSMIRIKKRNYKENCD
jgi:hypothetical protein